MSILAVPIPLRRPNTGFVRRPLLLIGVVLLGLFCAFTAYAVGHTYMPFDVGIERAVQAVTWGPLTRVFGWFDWLEGSRQMLAGLGAIAIVAVVSWRRAPLIAVAALAGPIYSVIQGVIERPRPSADLVNVIRHTGSFSFPSGHMVFFSWVLVMLVVGLGFGRLSRPMLAAAWVGVAIVLIVASLGRIYLGEHWPSDVIAGLALGLGWSAIALSVRRLSNPALEGRR